MLADATWWLQAISRHLWRDRLAEWCTFIKFDNRGRERVVRLQSRQMKPARRTIRHMKCTILLSFTRLLSLDSNYSTRRCFRYVQIIHHFVSLSRVLTCPRILHISKENLLLNLFLDVLLTILDTTWVPRQRVLLTTMAFICSALNGAQWNDYDTCAINPDLDRRILCAWLLYTSNKLFLPP